MYLRSILQSDEDLVLDEVLEIQVAIVRNSRGAGRGSLNKIMYIFGHGDSLHTTMAISKTRGSDNLCLAKSLAVALAKSKLVEANKQSNQTLVKVHKTSSPSSTIEPGMFCTERQNFSKHRQVSLLIIYIMYFLVPGGIRYLTINDNECVKGACNCRKKWYCFYWII